MKKINKLRLNNLSKTEMEKREMNNLRGGTCGCVYACGCQYAGGQCSSGDSYYGGSSNTANGGANSSNACNSVYAG